MGIYTIAGDGGETSLYSNRETKKIRVSKSSQIIKTIGAIDEANSYLGIISSIVKDKRFKMKGVYGLPSFAKGFRMSDFGCCTKEYSKSRKGKEQDLLEIIEEVQGDLFTIGGIVAGAKLELQSYKVTKLEKEIDRLEKMLPKQTNFILPGGTIIAAHLMYARALVRKAERELAELFGHRTSDVGSRILKYTNRLSDYLFILARWENYCLGYKDKVWKVR
jgi:cob(I)alamin adenosyltransferase